MAACPQALSDYSCESLANDPTMLTVPSLLTVAIMTAQALIEYAKRHGHVLAADDKGPMGVTALHLAALLPDNGAMGGAARPAMPPR